MEASLSHMFQMFNQSYFENKLDNVQLEFSTKMKTGAGIFYPQSKKHGNQSLIRLNKPLLALRSKKEQIDTLLHEMIHAFLREIGIQEQHGKHFKAKMEQINCLAGTNITIRHNYMKWWRCTGTCQEQQDKLFGYVFLMCHDTPGPKDSWWKDHNLKCCGIYVESSEPNKKTLILIKRTSREQKVLTRKENLTKKKDNS